jgi:hypothetical protein
MIEDAYTYVVHLAVEPVVFFRYLPRRDIVGVIICEPGDHLRQ